MKIKSIENSKAGKSFAVSVVISPQGEHVGTIKAQFPSTGNLIVNVDDIKAGKRGQHSQLRNGTGFDIESVNASLEGVTIDGITLHDYETEDQTCADYVKDYLAESNDAKAQLILEQAQQSGVIFTEFNPALGKSGRYTKARYMVGLDLLKHLGYKVIGVFNWS